MTGPSRPTPRSGSAYWGLQTLATRWTALGLGLAAALLAWGAAALGWLDGGERASWDARVRLLARPAPADSPLRLVVIDDASLVWAKEQLTLDWPWPRTVYGLLTQACRRAGAAGLAFDLHMPLPHPFPSSDAEFAAALGRASGELPVALPVFLGEETGDLTTWPPGVPPSPFSLTGLEAWREARSGDPFTAPAAAFPVQPLAAAAAVLGHVSGDKGPDGVVRDVRPLRLFAGQPVPELGLAVWAFARGVRELRLEPGRLGAGRLVLGDHAIPLDPRGRALPRFPAPPEAGGYLYPAIPAARLLETELRHQQEELEDEDDRTLLANLAGRWVFVGVSAPSLYDVYPTPVEATTTGLEIHAAVLDSLLTRSFLRPAPSGAVLLFTLALALTAAASTLHGHRLTRISTAYLLGLTLPALLGLTATASGWSWPVAMPTAAAGLALVAGTLVNQATEGRRRRFLHRAFGHYLSPAVIDRLIADPRRLELGGERRELTVFFSDLEAFSSISEGLDPHELTRLLNDYLSEMTDVILAEQGTLDKYEGDAILAFWNAPTDQPDHALSACRAAVACQRRLAARQEDFRRRAGRPLRMRIGIHTGEVVVGNLGSRSRFDYTVLGDAANLASRLEGANKAFGTALMVSEATWRRVEGQLFGREIGDLVVVGRQTPVKVFEPLGLAGEPQPEWLARWREAVAAARAGRRADALAAFETFAGDPVAQVWIDELRRTGDGSAGWDGLFRLTAK